MHNRAPRDLDGVVRLRRDLLVDGYTDQQIRRLVKSGVLHRIRRGAYVSSELWKDCSREDQHRIRCRAVLVAGHPLMVLTHVSAAVERGVPVWGIPLDEVHTTRTDAKSSRREAGVIHHVGVLKEEDVDVLNGVRVSTAARTAIEVSATSTLEASLVVANGMLHLGLISEDELRAEAHRLRYWPETLGNHVLLTSSTAEWDPWLSPEPTTFSGHSTCLGLSHRWRCATSSTT